MFTIITHSYLYLVAYFIGALPTGYWFAKYFFGIDITAHGSGNIGATNIGRILGKRYFFLIFFLDALKAYLFLTACITFFPLLSFEDLTLLAVMLLVGNRFSIFLNFQGGKGVATSLGILSALAPFPVSLFFVAWWLIIFVVFKQSYLAALSSSVATTLFCAVIFPSLSSLLFLLVFITIWLFTTHISNIKKALKK